MLWEGVVCLRCFPRLPGNGPPGSEEQWEDRDHSREGTLRCRRRGSSVLLMPSLEANETSYSFLFCCLLGHFRKSLRRQPV